ncbi:MAG TPA: hypothetical protein VNM89_01460, partial [Solirubrobacterales bacterium]|nr:hypothetical protein [Solirubrobacterales bacterium]
MRGLLVTALCAAVVAVAGCGDEDDERSPANGSNAPSGELSTECRPGEMESLLAGFIDAVDSRDEAAVAHHVAPQPELFMLTLYADPKPGEGRIDVQEPDAAYAGMRELTRGEDFVLVGAGVGNAPRLDKRSGPRANDPAAGVDFAYESKRRSITGKVGINCATGQIYTGAMTVRPGPSPRV